VPAPPQPRPPPYPPPFPPGVAISSSSAVDPAVLLAQAKELALHAPPFPQPAAPPTAPEWFTIAKAAAISHVRVCYAARHRDVFVDLCNGVLVECDWPEVTDHMQRIGLAEGRNLGCEPAPTAYKSVEWRQAVYVKADAATVAAELTAKSFASQQRARATIAVAAFAMLLLLFAARRAHCVRKAIHLKRSSGSDAGTSSTMLPRTLSWLRHALLGRRMTTGWRHMPESCHESIAVEKGGEDAHAALEQGGSGSIVAKNKWLQLVEIDD